LSNQDILLIYPELKFLFKYLTQDEQLSIFAYIKKNPIYLNDVDDPPLKKIVTSISKADIPVSTGIIILGSSLALFQGQINEFKNLIASEKQTNNPSVYNLLALEALLLKGNLDEGLSYITKAMALYTNLDHNQYSPEMNTILEGEEIFTQSLAYFCFQSLGKTELASEAFEEANRLQSVRKYKWEYFYYWLIYFKTRITIIQMTAYEEALQYTEDSLQLAVKLENRIFQGLSLQNKGRALIGLGRYLEGLKFYKDALKLFQLTNSIFLISIFSDLGNLEVKVSRFVQAKNFFQKTIIETQLLGGGLDFAPLLQLPGFKGLADLYLLQGNYYLAEESYLKTLVLARNAHAYDQEAVCLEKLGSINTEMNKFEIAQNYFIECLELKEKYLIKTASTLLEFGRMAIKLGNKDLALTQLFYLRNLAQTKNLGLEIKLFMAQIFILEKNTDQARLELEKLQIHAGKTLNVFQVRLQLILARLALIEANLDTKQQVTEMEEENSIEEENIEESIDRVRSILPYLEKDQLPAMQVLVILVKATINWLTSEKKPEDQKIFSVKIDQASKIAIEQKLLFLNTRIEFFQRRISRLRVRISYYHLYELCADIESYLRLT
jgi:tetratricopeptide (TPR) repeat protein